MTEENKTVDESQKVENTTVVADDNGSEVKEPKEEKETVESESPDDDDKSDEFPQKAVNALNRKNRKINKLRAQLRELENKLSKTNTQGEVKDVNPDDFENYGDYIDAKVKALVDQKTQQTQSEMHQKSLLNQKEQLKAERDQYIIEQANEVAKTFKDLPQVWQQNAQLLDSLPEQVADIFYSLENAPAAIYTLATEGKLESLLYANPALAAYEIVNAEKRGLELLSKPQVKVSQAPTPITKARGSGSVKKQLSPDDDVLKSLGFKK